ncbi:choice-of-anchor D domain-containing protein, partial [Wenzhouxiangella sp. XN79A]|uniref:choice-of-anchor D domain-containing protein n=1 Tax=Wenzhouxiangella sp. XN79A TaxID=2724193 RepID=UPI00144AF57C
PTAPTDVGSYAVVATVDDPNHTGSASGTLEITQATTTVSIDAIAPVAQQVAGQAYTVTVSVAGANPSGTVTIDDGHGVTCQFDLPAAGCELTSLVVGATTVTADYPGDANHSGGLDSIAYEIVAGSAASLVFTAQPTDAVVGQAITPAVQVEARDALDNPVADGTVILLALGANLGGGTLAGTLDASTTGGVATFADLSIDTAGAGYTLIASSAASNAESASFMVLTPAALTISPLLLDFGTVAVSSASTIRAVTLRNDGDVALNVSAVDAAPAPFESVPGQTTCPSAPFELAAGDTCDLAFRFTPSQEGISTADVTAFSDAGSATVTLSGEGVTLPQLVIVGPTLIDFGDLDIGDTSPAELIVIENLGDGDLVIDAIELVGPNGPQYLLEWNVAGMCTAGEVLAPGAFCGFEVRYAPVTGGVQEARIRIRSNDAGGPHWIDVRGTTDVAFHNGFESAP